MSLDALQFVWGNMRAGSAAGAVAWTGETASMSVSIIFSATRIIFKARRVGDSRRSGDGPRFSGVQAIVRTARPARRPPWSET
ncbi:TPA: hypothetical protein QDC20_008013 [Burkholderia aenigmatica]|uniref:hypothetical protein n=1 Tax=Burkholderia sp. AU45251 TaxID=3059204 RepID=UPI002652D6D2|nr:hypothetical protein [Burkholderia sp. AU45251]HDR9482935.1 hypothetical protein [Burkholderia aenigmatica]MDN7515800.1 hypothetical protein [Burkholderia sp. AU45251]HDR9488470.1 hypothetical protein [Burkholderia aenigmatica]HDR9513882.1 hypothetical protein [Burkholderia aenigmatica]HDR9520650.1 hypothetical protein [Burkholderia aenigmatica]